MAFASAEEDSRHSFGEAEDSLLNDDSNDVYQKLEAVVEYEWPLGSGQDYFIEEYLANYLGIKSIRRSYPKLKRRRVLNLNEREYLMRRGIVTELQCDLGVMVIDADQVYAVIAPDHKSKFTLYSGVKWQNNYEEIVRTSWDANLNSYEAQQSSSATAEELRSAAMKSCASWNAMNNERARKERTKFNDLQTGSGQKRKGRSDVGAGQDNEQTKVGCFPVMVLHGQFVDHIPRFSSEQLHHFPLNTVLRGPSLSANGSKPKTESYVNNGENESTVWAPEGESSCSYRSSEEPPLSNFSFETFDSDMYDASGSSSTITCSSCEFDSDYCGCDPFFLDL